MYKEITQCRICGSSDLINILSLGNLAVSDFLNSDNISTTFAPLDLIMCNNETFGCGLVQLKHTVSPDLLYRNYWYRSGINQTMRDELKNIVIESKKRVTLEKNDIVLDIGSNDGTLLRNYDKDVYKVGFEPAKNLYNIGSEGANKIICDFFNAKNFISHFSEKKAKIITAIGMFYDLDNPNKFVEDIVKCLDKDGILVIQMMYMPLALEKNAFDGICHEHLLYYSMKTLNFLLKKNKLKIFDVELRENINEGSARFYIKHEDSFLNNDDDHNRVKNLEDLEDKCGVNSVDRYKKFASDIYELREKTVNLLESIVEKGGVIHGYAASTKGNTTLQFYDLSSKIIKKIAERNPEKCGLRTVSTNIEIISEESSRIEKPDYYFILAWHFLPEFINREKEFIENGGKFIVPMPDLKIISK